MFRLFPMLVAAVLLTGAPAQADTRVFVMFDMSDSMNQPMDSQFCIGPRVQCLMVKAEAQLQVFKQALFSLQPPQCAPISLKLVFWNVFISYNSNWIDVSDAKGVQTMQATLKVAPRVVETVTNQRLAFDYAVRILRKAPQHDYAVIMVSDGNPSDDWSVSYGSRTAQLSGFLFYNITFADSITSSALRQKFVDNLAEIQDTLHGCIG